MEALPGNVLLRIAELSPDNTGIPVCSRLRLLCRAIHSKISSVHHTLLVAKVRLRSHVHARHGEMLKLVVEECEMKIKAHSAAAAHGRLVSLALTSTTLERQIIANATEVKKQQVRKASRVMKRTASDGRRSRDENRLAPRGKVTYLQPSEFDES